MAKNENSRTDTAGIGINRLIHEPARLSIIVHLYIVESGDFVYLKRETGLSWGNLSVQVSKLEAAGYVVVHKEFVDKKSHTVVALTKKGIAGYEEYRDQIRSIIK